MSRRVEKLIPSKHVEGRWYAVFEDGDSVRVSVAVIADFSLYSGRELSEEEYEGLKRSAARMNAKARAMRVLGLRMMSRKELYERLIEKGEAEEDAAEAVDYLESLGIIDDGDYAAAIVRGYSGKGYGAARIKDELYRRGIPRELWDAALLELPDGTDAIDALVSRKLRGTRPDRRELKRLTDMLMRRGYSWGEVSSALARYDFSEEFTDE